MYDSYTPTTACLSKTDRQIDPHFTNVYQQVWYVFISVREFPSGLIYMYMRSVWQVFCGVYLLAPRTQTDHGRRVGSGAGVGEDGIESDGEVSDLTRMLRMEGE